MSLAPPGLPDWLAAGRMRALSRAARPAAAAAGASPDTDARRLQVELRLLF